VSRDVALTVLGQPARRVAPHLVLSHRESADEIALLRRTGSASRHRICACDGCDGRHQDQYRRYYEERNRPLRTMMLTVGQMLQPEPRLIWRHSWREHRGRKGGRSAQSSARPHPLRCPVRRSHRSPSHESYFPPHSTHRVCVRLVPVGPMVTSFGEAGPPPPAKPQLVVRLLPAYQDFAATSASTATAVRDGKARRTDVSRTLYGRRAMPTTRHQSRLLVCETVVMGQLSMSEPDFQATSRSRLRGATSVSGSLRDDSGDAGRSAN